MQREREIDYANRIQEACYTLFTRLETELAPTILSELQKRASEGHTDAHINFDRETFSDTGIARPRDVMRMFLDELANPDSVICTDTAGKLKGVKYDVWNNVKHTVHFAW